LGDNKKKIKIKMAYSNQKGWQGQEEVKIFLEKIFKDFGIQFFNVSGSEKKKKVMAGDVVKNDKTDPMNKCVLAPYFIEVKKQASPNIFKCAEKAKDDAESWGKNDFILFVNKQKRGELGRNAGQKLVVMSWKTFGDIIAELQGFREYQ
jgi:hypothetical protein